MIIELEDDEEYLAHYGILRKSGRYPWGSGGDIPQRSRSFLDYVDMLKSYGLTDAEIAKGTGLESTTNLRATRSIANNAVKQANIDEARRLKDKQYSNMEIGRKMNLNESSVRNLLKDGEKEKADNLRVIADMLKGEVAAKTYVDVGIGVELQLALSRTKLDIAIAILKQDGEYTVHNVQTPQPMGQNQKTTVKVLAPPGTTYKDVVQNLDKIQQIRQYSENNGRSFDKILPPLSVNSKRIAINYAEDGGAQADGVIFVRPGVHDVSLGKARYAQVRIAVDGTHYLKGMAMYKDDLPAGKDLVFNTNKSNTGNKLDAMKPLKDDPENPFGSVIRQLGKRDANGNKVLTSSMNLVNEEGDWDKWSKTLSSQMLSKQSSKLAKEQLDLTYEKRRNQLDEIMTLTNPSVRKKLLETYADSTDSAAVHLKAAALPRQRGQVILPVNSLKDHEIYAPNFRQGEIVVLVRHPHGGPFEIPELVVNNSNRAAKKALGQAKDAIGINAKVAAKLSGADFDGDTVLVIPNNDRRVSSQPTLIGLKNFDPQREYPSYEGMPKMSPRTKQTEMGKISNLITDMTIKGASKDELARAVRHSMVVIDAEKHNLNYRQSAINNGIPALKQKYQNGARGGASTLISLAGSRPGVRATKPRPAAEGGPIDKATGKLVFVPKGEPFVNKQGKTVTPTAHPKRLSYTEDAHKLSSGTPIEKLYADHSNKLKALANEARKEAVNTKAPKWNSSAKTAYAPEVDSLNAKLNLAMRNAPLERQATLIANAAISAKRAANPDMDDAEIKKLKFLEQEKARVRTGAGKQKIEITDKEWAAIQAGAISPSKLDKILKHADLEIVKKLATPKTPVLMTSAKKRRMMSMLNSGYPQSDIADALGVSLSTLKTAMNGGE